MLAFQTDKAILLALMIQHRLDSHIVCINYLWKPIFDAFHLCSANYYIYEQEIVSRHAKQGIPYGILLI